MEALIGGLIVVVIGQGALIWQRLGRLEGKVEELCRARDGDQDY